MNIVISHTFQAYAWYCLTGTITTILPILQDNHHPNNRPGTVFYHPLMQTEMMIVGQMLCLFVFLFSKERPKYDDSKPRAPWAVCLIPLAMDLLASSMQMVALNYLSGSVYSITSSIVIVSTAFFSKLLLKKTFNLGQISGCIFAIVGVLLTGFAEYVNGSSDAPKDLFLLGLILTLVAHVIEGLEMVVIEIIFTKYSISPNEFVGIMGAAGTVFWTLLMVLLSFLGCPLESSQCVLDYDGNQHLQHAPSFFQDLRGDPFLIVMVIINILAISRFNYDLNKIIVIADAMVFQVVNIFSNSFVWLVGIIITLCANGNDEFMIESLGYEVILMKLAGFILSTIGLFLYNGVICNKENKDVEDKNEGLLMGEQESGGQIESEKET